MTRRLTPYDTGARAEPQVWVVGNGDPDRYGKVDFDDSESNTIATVWFEGTRGGSNIMHVMVHAGDIERITIHQSHDPIETTYIHS